MSEELQALLQRTQKKEAQPYKEPSPEPSPALLSLLGRMEARRWREETLAETVEYIRECANEIKLIKHLRKCRQCQMEASLSVERYGGRCLPWFLDLTNGDIAEFGDEDPRFKDCPPVRNYRIGSYWDKTIDSKETMKFINDRINWAEKHIKQQIWTAVDYYRLLKEWDLTEPYPIEENLPF